VENLNASPHFADLRMDGNAVVSNWIFKITVVILYPLVRSTV